MDRIRRLIRDIEEERIRRAYTEQPDSEGEADDWSAAEAWNCAAELPDETI
jgi:hypothetical protein